MGLKKEGSNVENELGEQYEWKPIIKMFSQSKWEIVVTWTEGGIDADQKRCRDSRDIGEDKSIGWDRKGYMQQSLFHNSSKNLSRLCTAFCNMAARQLPLCRLKSNYTLAIWAPRQHSCMHPLKKSFQCRYNKELL